MSTYGIMLFTISYYAFPKLKLINENSWVWFVDLLKEENREQINEKLVWKRRVFAQEIVAKSLNYARNETLLLVALELLNN